MPKEDLFSNDEKIKTPRESMADFEKKFPNYKDDFQNALLVVRSQSKDGERDSNVWEENPDLFFFKHELSRLIANIPVILTGNKQSYLDIVKLIVENTKPAVTYAANPTQIMNLKDEDQKKLQKKGVDIKRDGLNSAVHYQFIAKMIDSLENWDKERSFEEFLLYIIDIFEQDLVAQQKELETAGYPATEYPLQFLQQMNSKTGLSEETLTRLGYDKNITRRKLNTHVFMHRYRSLRDGTAKINDDGVFIGNNI